MDESKYLDGNCSAVQVKDTNGANRTPGVFTAVAKNQYLLSNTVGEYEYASKHFLAKLTQPADATVGTGVEIYKDSTATTDEQNIAFNQRWTEASVRLSVDQSTRTEYNLQNTSGTARTTHDTAN